MPSFAQLSEIRHRVVVGQPLPFNIRNQDGTLLLAANRVVENEAQLEALLARGVLVDMAELMTPADKVRVAPPEALPALWQDCLSGVNKALLAQPGSAGFLSTLTQVSEPVLALVGRDKDLSIFQLLRQEGNAHAQYGLNHSAHTAITAYLVALRLGWSAADAERALKVGLTMNLAMLQLQGELAEQAGPPTPAQRQAILAHPEASRHMLEVAGVTDTEWLRAVAEHHESPDGKGYPHGSKQPCDTAELVRRADIYMAKLSPRKNRSAVAADKAGRMMFMQEPNHPMASALVKEFGVYPPGCWVRLSSGESGLVVRQGSTVMTPIVAVTTTAQGARLAEPLRRDTQTHGYGVQAVLDNPAPPVPVAPEVLARMAA